jgi:hypothetical protein
VIALSGVALGHHDHQISHNLISLCGDFLNKESNLAFAGADQQNLQNLANNTVKKAIV